MHNEQIFNSNIKLMKHYRSYFPLPPYKLPGGLGAELISEPTKNESVTVKANIDGKWQYLYSKYNPQAEAERELSAIEIKPDTIMIMFGLGLGYHAGCVLSKMGDKNSLMIVEPSRELLDIALRNVDLSDVIKSKRTVIITNDNKSEIMEMLSINVRWETYSQVKVFIPQPYKTLYPEKCKDFLTLVKETQTTNMINRNTIISFSHDWQINILANIPTIVKSYPVKAFQGAFENIPVIIVSAGPSLNKNIGELKRLKGKAVILAVDTAVKVLKSNGIEADFVFTLDAQNHNFLKVKDVEFDNSPLVYTDVANTKILNHHKGKKILSLNLDDNLFKLFDEMGIEVGTLVSGGSVACIAYDFATKSGSKKVIFIGQDLAYTNDLTHAVGTVHDARNSVTEKLKATTFLVDDVFGGKVRSDKVLMTYLSWFANSIKFDKPLGIEFIDATEGGAYIPGTKVETFAKVADDICAEHNDVNIQEIVDKVFAGDTVLNSEQLTVFCEKYDKSLKKLTELLPDIEAAVKQSSRLRKLYEYSPRPKEKDVTSILKRLDKTDMKIKRAGNELIIINNLFLPIMDELVYSPKFKIPEELDEQKRSIQIAENSLYLYGGLKLTITKVLPHLKRVTEELKLIVSEKKERSTDE